MTEKEAIKQFYECAGNDDTAACLEALKELSVHTVNKQDDDGYTLLISAAVAGNPCAVEALLRSGKCDWTLEENLCGLNAVDYGMHYPADSRIYNAFMTASRPQWLYRNGKVVPQEELFQKIMEDALEADSGCFALLDDCSCVELLLKGKVSREEFEKWTTPDGIDWQAQLLLLANDEEFGRKFVNWEYIRQNVDADDFFAFLKNFPRQESLFTGLYRK